MTPPHRVGLAPFFMDDAVSAMFIDSLSDSELRRRLRQRGLDFDIVEHLIADRDDDRAMQRIVRALRA